MTSTKGVPRFDFLFKKKEPKKIPDHISIAIQNSRQTVAQYYGITDIKQFIKNIFLNAKKARELGN